MSYILAFILALGFACSAVFAAEPKLPADAAKLVEAFDADAAKIRADAEKVVDKKAAELAVKLSKAQDAATKKGDLDGALAIKAAVEKLSLKREIEKPVADVSSVVGMWQLTMKGSNYKSMWTFDKKGGVTNSEGNTGKFTLADEKVAVTWETGATEYMVTPEKGARTTTGTSVNGIALTFTKQ